VNRLRFGRDKFAPIAVTTRSGIDESLHHGVAVVLGADGTVTDSIGDPDVTIYPRSSLKPIQANAMVRAGFDVPQHLLALAAASHCGAPRHIAAAADILARHGLAERDLLNTAAHPWCATEREQAIGAGVSPSPLQHTCSGKHAAMLATCRINGWPTSSYLDEAHPLQQAVRAEIERLTGRSSVVHVGVDGCGAPAFVMPLIDLAQAMRALMLERSIVAEAIAAEPWFVGGSGRDVTAWMIAVPGLVMKDGADGVVVIALPDGRAGALKVADGSEGARQAVSVELLRRLGIDVDAHPSVLADVRVLALGGGVPVGECRPLEW
jgi:L-asparaginase II